MSIFPRPGERVIEAPKAGQIITRAGDRRRREAALAARRAETEARANDPEKIQEDQRVAEAAHRDRLLGAVADAQTRSDRIEAERNRLMKMLDDVDNQTLRTGKLDRGAAAIQEKLSQLPRILERADLEIATARAVLLQFEVGVAERAAAREAERVAIAADEERRQRAEEAARKAFDAVMAEDATIAHNDIRTFRKSTKKATQ